PISSEASGVLAESAWTVQGQGVDSVGNRRGDSRATRYDVVFGPIEEVEVVALTGSIGLKCLGAAAAVPAPARPAPSAAGFAARRPALRRFRRRPGPRPRPPRENAWKALRGRPAR